MSDTKTTPTAIPTLDHEAIVQRYLGVWAIEDEQDRREAVAEIWAPDGVEFVQGLRFEGHNELAARVARAHDAFFATGRYVAGYDEDLTVHQDILRFTITLSEPANGKPGELAWSARTFLLLDDDGKVQQSYQVTVKALPA
jgi:hypothetical protein